MLLGISITGVSLGLPDVLAGVLFLVVTKGSVKPALFEYCVERPAAGDGVGSRLGMMCRTLVLCKFDLCVEPRGAKAMVGGEGEIDELGRKRKFSPPRGGLQMMKSVGQMSR